MPTSTSRTSSTAGIPLRGPGQRGFTLLELLVVVVLVALLTGSVILGFTGADTEQRLRGSAEQLAYTIELARQYALQRNREWGLYVEPDALQFAEFDPEAATWVIQENRPFAAPDLPPGVALRVEAEGLGELAAAAADELPQVMLFSSGEVTPFTLWLEPDGDALAWRVSSDGLSRSAAERAEF